MKKFISILFSIYLIAIFNVNFLYSQEKTSTFKTATSGGGGLSAGANETITGDWSFTGSVSFTTVTITALTATTSITITGLQDGDALLALDADEGDDNPDSWFIISEASGNDLSFVNHETERMNLTSAGDLQVDGAITVGADASITSTLGKFVTFPGGGDIMYLSHYDFATNVNYALHQQNTGLTTLNAPTGQTVNVSINNSPKIQISSATVKINPSGLNVDFQVYTDNEDSAFVVDGTDGDIYMEGLGTGSGRLIARIANTDEIVEVLNAEIYDIGDLASESLANIADFSHGDWTLGGEVAVDGGTKAKYTYATTGNGSITQTSGNMTIAGVGSRWYVFDYTVSGVAGLVGGTVTITTAFALTAVTLDVTSNGAQSVTFKSAVTPANFIINITGVTAGTFTIDEVSLKMVNGGDLTIAGGITASRDSPQTFIFGRTVLHNLTSSYAHFSHINVATTTEYALRQSSNGATILNSASGQTLSLDVGNALKFVLSANLLQINPSGTDFDFQVMTDNEDSAFVVDGTDGDIYMEGLGSGVGNILVRIANTDEIVEATSDGFFLAGVQSLAHLYGTMGFADSSQTIDLTTGVWAKITQESDSLFSTGINRGLLFLGDSIQVPIAGDYKISLSFSGANSQAQDEIHIGIFIDNVEEAVFGQTHQESAASTDVQATFTILNLAVDDWISFRVKIVTGGDRNWVAEVGNVIVQGLYAY